MNSEFQFFSIEASLSLSGFIWRMFETIFEGVADSFEACVMLKLADLSSPASLTNS